MSSVKIDRHSEIDELIARIYLDTKIKLTKKQLLELMFDMNFENYDLLVQRVQSKIIQDNEKIRRSFIKTFSGKIEMKGDEIDPKSIWKTTVEE